MERLTRADIESIVNHVINSRMAIHRANKIKRKPIQFTTKSIDWLCITQFVLLIFVIITTNNRMNNISWEIDERMRTIYKNRPFMAHEGNASQNKNEFNQMPNFNSPNDNAMSPNFNMEFQKFNISEYIEKANATVANAINSFGQSLLNDQFIERLLKKLIIKYSYEMNHHLYWLTPQTLQMSTVTGVAAYLQNTIKGFPMEESSIFNLNIFASISNWIGYQCKFKLLYRASKDGYTAKAFHDKCDGKFPTVTIIRNTMGKIFGGYTPIAWESPKIEDIWTVKSDRSFETFIFSISMKKKFSLKNPTKAIMCHAQYGPCFGGYSIAVGENCRTTDSSLANSFDNKDYELITPFELIGNADGTKFTVDDYEVFEIDR